MGFGGRRATGDGGEAGSSVRGGVTAVPLVFDVRLKPATGKSTERIAPRTDAWTDTCLSGGI